MKIKINNERLKDNFLDIFDINNDFKIYIPTVIGYTYFKNINKNTQEIVLYGNIKKNNKDLQLLLKLYNISKKITINLIKKITIKDLKKINLEKNDIFLLEISRGITKLKNYINNNWKNLKLNDKIENFDLYINIIETYFILNNIINISKVSFDNKILRYNYSVLDDHDIQMVIIEIFNHDNFYKEIDKNKKNMTLILNQMLKINAFNILDPINRDLELFYTLGNDYYILSDDNVLDIHLISKPKNITYKYILDIIKNYYENRQIKKLKIKIL